MDELGVQLIFARSPQAKGRVERTAGTPQDRLVTELRLARATTIDEANLVLADFLPRFNQRFRVPAHHSEPAYRVLETQVCLDTILCLKFRRRVARDNTVKYRWHTLQLLPCKDRPSYAGAVVDVLEGLDGQLAVQHEGRAIPSQEAPQRPNILRSFNRRTVHTTAFPLNGTDLIWKGKFAELEVKAPHGSNGSGRVRRATKPRRRKPTPLQTARWRAVRGRSARACPSVALPGS